MYHNYQHHIVRQGLFYYIYHQIMKHQFRQATDKDLTSIWTIIQDAIKRRKEDGSNQWQDGYPNLDVLQNDLDKNAGFVLTTNNTIIGYCALFINDEPEYNNLNGKWLSNSDYVVFHRLAISKNHLNKGNAKRMFKYIEDFTISKNIQSIKADTNHDNAAMINLFEKLNYIFCGKVHYNGSPRNAYEKLINID